MDYPNQVISIGYNNPAVVSVIKNRLNELGYGKLTPSIPNYGLETMKAVKQFQFDNNLVRDGEIGELTWARLFGDRGVKAVSSDIFRIRMLEIAFTQLHVRELTNHNDGIDVEKYLHSTGLHKGEPYCQSGIHWCGDEAARQLNTKNLVPNTGSVLECYRIAKEKGYIITGLPEKGDQFFMDFGGGKGHAGLVNRVTPSGRIFTVEFNTTIDPTTPEEDRNGGKNGGCFERNRAIHSIKGFARYQ